MTRLRYVLVSVTTTLLALAAGIALGAGPLQGEIGAALSTDTPATEAGSTDAADADPALDQVLGYVDAIADQLAPQLLSETLDGRRVLLLTTSDVDADVVDDLTARIEQAGGDVTTRLTLQDELLDPAARNLVDSLSAQLMPKYPALDVSPSSPVYDRAGALLARTLVGQQGASPAIDEAARSVLSSFSTAGLVTGRFPRQRADLAVLMTGAEPVEESAATARAQIITALARELDRGSNGAVVAAATGAAAEPDVLLAVRSDPASADVVSSVGAVERTAGRVAVALALAEQLRGDSGHYGVDAPDGVLPPTA